MCISPVSLPNGSTVACRKCWQCRENRINDWVGRCIAESETAKASHSITLTYGRDDQGRDDHLRAAVLTYSDVQKYFKRLRRNGFPCRYFAVGEYGSAKGRAHWHLVVFWQDGVSEHQEGERFQERHWPLGYSYWEKPSPAAIRYVCKYILKDFGEMERQGHLSMSKKPPLGDRYFRELAKRYVDQRIAPIEPYYWFNHVRDDQDRPLKFYLQGVSLDNFCAAFLHEWDRRVGGHPPPSTMLEEHCDRVAKYVPDYRPERFKTRVPYPWVRPPDGAPVYFAESVNNWFTWVNGQKLWWSYTDEGDRGWHEKIRVEAEADRLRADALRRSDPRGYIRKRDGT